MANTIKKDEPYRPRVYSDFSGCWNVDTPPDLLKDNECEVFDNIDTSYAPGALKKRAGCSKLNTTAFTADCNKLWEWNRKNGTTQYLGMVGYDVVIFDTSGTTPTWAPTVLKTLDDTDIGYFFFQDKFYFTGKESEVDKYWCYSDACQSEGLDVSLATVITANGNVKLTITSAILTGSPLDIIFAVAKDDTAIQVATKASEALAKNSAVMAKFKASTSSNKIILTALTAAATDNTMNIAIVQVDSVGLSAVATSSTITDGATLAVSEVTPYDDETCDLNPIKKCRYFTWNPKNNRIFATGNPNDSPALYYSEANQPSFFKRTNILYPTQGEGVALGVTSFSTGVIVEYENGLWSWTGIDPADDAIWSKIPVAHGCIEHGTVYPTPNSLTMLAHDGLHALSPGVLDKDLTLISSNEMSVNISAGRVNSVLRDASHINTAVSCYQITKQRYLLAYGDDSSNPKNNRILVFDFNLNGFIRFTGIEVNDFCACADGDILIASGTYILKMEQGLDDYDITLGAAKSIEVKISTKPWDLDAPFYIKKIKKLFLTAHQFMDTETTIDLDIEGGYKSVSFRDVLIDESFTWGSLWGRVWGWTDIITKEFRARLKAIRFQTIITHNHIGEDLLIYGLSFSYKTTRMKGVKYNGDTYKDILG